MYSRVEVDDVIIVGPESLAVKCWTSWARLLVWVGFPIGDNTWSEDGPCSQKFEAMGWEINTDLLRRFFCGWKRVEMTTVLNAKLNTNTKFFSISLHEIESIVGRLRYARYCGNTVIPRMFYLHKTATGMRASFEKKKLKQPHLTTSNFYSKFKLSSNLGLALADIPAWLDKGVPLMSINWIPQSHQFVFYVDASDMGVGIWSPNFSKCWFTRRTGRMAKSHVTNICTLEGVAIVMAALILKSLTNIERPVMWIYTDNMSVFWTLLRKEAKVHSNHFWMAILLEMIEDELIVIKPIWINTHHARQ